MKTRSRGTPTAPHLTPALSAPGGGEGGAAATAFPLRPSGGRGRGPRRRRGRVRWAPQSLGRLQGAAALRFRQLAQNHPALEGRDVIDEQHTVEMVDLVLQAGGEEALGVDLADLVLVVEIAQPDRRRARDIGIMLGQRQTDLVAERG